jgi:hypothetical protein
LVKQISSLYSLVWLVKNRTGFFKVKLALMCGNPHKKIALQITSLLHPQHTHNQIQPVLLESYSFCMDFRMSANFTKSCSIFNQPYQSPKSKLVKGWVTKILCVFPPPNIVVAHKLEDKILVLKFTGRGRPGGELLINKFCKSIEDVFHTDSNVSLSLL